MKDMLHTEATHFDRVAATHHGRMVLFGLGGLGRKLLRCLLKHSIVPVALCDNNPRLWHTEIEGIAVLPPDEMAATYGSNAIIAVAIYQCIFSDSNERAFAEMADSLRKKGCATIISYLPLFWKFASEMLPTQRMGLPSEIIRNRDKVRKVFDVLGDNASRSEFVLHIGRLLTGDLESWQPTQYDDIPYFPKHFLPISATETFVDAGAFTGDTIEIIRENTHEKFKNIIAFEPDPENFRGLQAYVARLPAALQQRITLHQKGLWKETSELRFDASGTTGASISGSGAQTIHVTALDDVAGDIQPTYIKMDIEGAEPEALAGARRTIERCHPKLAVCNNHYQHHLWEIPLSIHAMHPAYRFYLRRDFPDLICYAIP